MKELIDYLLTFGDFKPCQLELITGKAQLTELRKDEYFSKAGQVPRQVGFVVEGVLRGCYYTHTGEEVTRCFISENSLVADYLNFEANLVSSEYLQACTDCKLLTFSRLDWDSLSELVEGWDIAKYKMVQVCLYQKSRKAPVISQDATTRYLEFLERHPLLVNRVPLAYVASYLGVTQQSLSRIRRTIR
ncbi:hypothetical protein DYBT9275_05433 [Dyadobacter sp. CECT 9275]|uniref:Crp/Fnr family transcriptional regulator n=1 Tax=Dyadobacter helix TaxID=2822344 RepID=A0A916NEE3_9BACT|nr:Crp/Fnr family transcriptional regulator [Dyadobacter sp. CECT 9275]CAG5015875.1 hypothetical protein DYBT9275_05433 [Dyadobacter sp. CECT 9275]